MNVHTIQFHIGDFLSGVMHMDGAEVGAYTMLIMAHYQAGAQGLPDDDKKLRQIAKSNTRSWLKIKETVLEKFYLEDGFWRHERVVGELQKIASKAGTGRPKKTQEEPLRETLNDFQKSIKGNAKKNKPLKNKETQKTNQYPITNNQKEEKINKKEVEKSFEEFWQCCPRKVGKGKAREKYFIAVRSVTPQLLLDAMRRHKREVKDTETEFIPHPATWLHGERYHDELSLPETEPIGDWPEWKLCLARRIGEHNVKGWFSGVVMHNGSLRVPRRFQADKIKNEFSIEIENALGKPYAVELMQ